MHDLDSKLKLVGCILNLVSRPEVQNVLNTDVEYASLVDMNELCTRAFEKSCKQSLCADTYDMNNDLVVYLVGVLGLYRGY